MPYATATDIEIVYGRGILDAVADRDGTGRRDMEAVNSALASASAEIDTYLGSRYTVPLVSPPPYIKQLCVDIAVYRMALDIGPRTEEMRLRYEDAIGYLNTVAGGKIDLPITGDGGTGDGNTAGTSAKVIGSKRG